MNNDFYDSLLPLEKIFDGIKDYFNILIDDVSSSNKEQLFDQYIRGKTNDIRYLFVPNDDAALDTLLLRFYEYKLKIDPNLSKNFEMDKLCKETFKNKDLLNLSNQNIEGIIFENINNKVTKEKPSIENNKENITHLSPKKQFEKDCDYLFYKIFFPRLKDYVSPIKLFLAKRAFTNLMYESVKEKRTLPNKKNADLSTSQSVLLKRLFGKSLNYISDGLSSYVPQKTLDGIEKCNQLYETCSYLLQRRTIFLYEESKQGKIPSRPHEYIDRGMRLSEEKYEFDELEKLDAMTTLVKSSINGFVLYNKPDFVALCLEKNYFISTPTHEILHLISANKSQGIVSRISGPFPSFNEILTEFFTNKIMAIVQERIPSPFSHQKETRTTYYPLVKLLDTFLNCYENELKKDYIKGSLGELEIEKAIGQQDFKIIAIITKKILDILIDNPDLFKEITDFDLFLDNYDELTKNSTTANDIYIYNECKNLVLELKEAALQAVEKKNKQKKVKIIS